MTERPLRVAYLVSRFPKLTETFVLYEALALRDAGLEVTIHPLVDHREDVQHPEVDALADAVRGTRVGFLGGAAALGSAALRSPLRLLRAALAGLRATGGSPAHLARGIALFPRVVRLAADLHAAGVDHVHAHFATHPTLAARVARELSGIPYSFTAHGSDLHRDPRGLREKILGARAALTVSDYNKRFMAQHAGQDLLERIEVARCGADLGRFVPRGTSTPGGPLRVACVAALREVKGHEHLLRACALLRERGVPVHCALAGDGPLRADLAALVDRLGLTDTVELLGPLDRDGVRELLGRSDVSVLTSVQDRAGRREGIPVTLMEGMACGLPVVASDLSGIPELVRDGETGLLAPPGDAEGIADALERLAADPALRKRLGDAGRALVTAEYDLARNAALLAARLGELARGAPA